MPVEFPVQVQYLYAYMYINIIILVILQFRQNPELLEKLLETRGTTLVEASPRDCRWGIGLGEKNPKALNRKTWRGSNWLGEILTELREEIIAEKP